ncbi:MAG: hypothetical protein OEV28_02675 [Nitrospirota bacterium]|nr:hypothetical protein [Nitrospirota bacterium]
MTLSRLFFLMMLAVSTAISTAYAADESLVIGRMKVSIWPEYDTEGILVVYEGRFADKDLFPRQVTFVLPKDVDELTDACSLSPGGEHFCQLYKVTQREDRAETRMQLPYADFFIDFQYYPFERRAQKELVYPIRSLYPVKILEVNVQPPLRAKDISVEPAPDRTIEAKGFTQHIYEMRDLPAGDLMTVKLRYEKDDDKPSVEIKYGGGMKKKDSTRANIGRALLLLTGVVLLGGIAWLRWKGQKSSKVERDGGDQ